eukprot:TRINITY_DN3410_c0_g1_i10.p2 TRINITY_DN3410_c0_g1~~TRINITY_DN3410_c0_g1_i10.p2  ORF type:complete len:249 (+),score=64.15 TRINITY_DN3410_c0_g1_i10:203-949(+)
MSDNMTIQARRKLVSQPANQPLVGHEHSISIFSEEEDLTVGPVNPLSKEVSRPEIVHEIKGEGFEDSNLARKTFEERMEYFKERHKKNIEVVEMERLNAEKIQCPFAPQLRSGKKQRTVNEFLQNQQRFVEERRRRLEFIGSRINEEQERAMQKAPKLNRKSLVLAERRRSQSKDIHERLFNEHSEKKGYEKSEVVSKCYPISTNKNTHEYIRKRQGKELEEIWTRVVGERRLQSLEQLCKYRFNSYR